jgi:hypothetical protein
MFEMQSKNNPALRLALKFGESSGIILIFLTRDIALFFKIFKIKAHPFRGTIRDAI